MHLKICGITNEADARVAADAAADFIGLIRAASPRQVSLDIARQIVTTLPSSTTPVLLYRNAPVDEVVTGLEVTGCQWVQLHGDEPVSLLREVQDRVAGVQMIKAWSVTTPADGAALRAYVDEAAQGGVRLAVVLLDAPKGGPHPGYEALAAMSRVLQRRPPAVWCAGALTPDNVAAALALGDYDGVDVASGVEASPGQKDADAVRRFAKAVTR